MEDGEAEGGAGPGGVGGPDALQADEAGEGAGGGGRQEGLDLGEVRRRCGGVAAELQIGFENGVGEVGVTEDGRAGGPLVGVGVGGVGEEAGLSARVARLHVGHSSLLPLLNLLLTF